MFVAEYTAFFHARSQPLNGDEDFIDRTTNGGARGLAVRHENPCDSMVYGKWKRKIKKARSCKHDNEKEENPEVLSAKKSGRTSRH